jgi:hypothetical protein
MSGEKCPLVLKGAVMDCFKLLLEESIAIQLHA